MLRANFYPRPPRGGRRRNAAHSRKQLRISIHALREEGDGLGVWDYSNQPDFYPRPPRGGRRGYNFRIKVKRDFYPRPPRGGRRACGRVCFRVCTISIHALREEGDTSPADAKGAGKIFLSTPSARRATAKTETKSLFSYKLYNILHEFRRALIYNGSKNYPNHAKRLENPVRRCRKDAENSLFAPGRKTQNNSRPSCSKGG